MLMTPGPNYEINYRPVVALSTVAICCYLEKDYHGLVSLRKQNHIRLKAYLSCTQKRPRAYIILMIHHK